ncbi:MAG TPA: hypothetical protein VG841_12505 [Caulobacterales bacterium]|nr:hypothetical protein [Caulobacterales bacterium]
MTNHPANLFLTEHGVPLGVRAAALIVSLLAVVGFFLQIFAAGARIVA